MSVYQQIERFRDRLTKSQPSAQLNVPSADVISTIEMHTGGEPLRVIVTGTPELTGNTVLERRACLRDEHDVFRKQLMFEPRGHADMYGCVLVPPNDADGDFGIIFLHNEGYSTMCGHAIIAISTLAWNMGWKTAREGDDNILLIDAPCGRITSFAEIENGKVSRIRFHCVPSFTTSLDQEIQIPGVGSIFYDVAFGGAFYAYVDLAKNNLDFSITPANYQEAIRLGSSIKRAVIETNREIVHPLEPEMSFLYGTIFIEAAHDPNNHSRNVCVFADGEVDRCPTGSGVSGRMAIHFARDEVAMGQKIRVESIINTCFTGSVVEKRTFAGRDAVIPEIEGSAYLVGQNNFWIETGDPIKSGFLLR